MATDPKIFKAYDIRGIYPVQVNKEVAYKIGRAFVQFTAAKKVVVGQDARLSSAELAKHLIQGIIDQGASVIDIRLASTPMLALAMVQYGLDGGINVTASHNPKQYNGFKLFKAKAVPLGIDDGLKEIKELVLANNFETALPKGQIVKKDILDDYVNNIFKHIPSQSIGDFKIVADAGNGMAGLIFPKFFAKLNCQVTPLFWDLDGSFPNRLPNPRVAGSLDILKKEIIAKKADLGIATDGDADRIIFVSEKGETIRADLVAALIGQMILKKQQGQKVIFSVGSSKVVQEVIEESGGQPIISKVGHSFIQTLMIKEKAVFAGEASGHYFFRDNNSLESPFVAVLYLLKLISQAKKPISEIIRPLQKYFSSDQINFDVKDKKGVMEKVEKNYQQGQISHLDGLSIEFDDWWFNLRPSNTEPWLRLNLESKTKELLKQKIKEVSELIK